MEISIYKSLKERISNPLELFKKQAFFKKKLFQLENHDCIALYLESIQSWKSF